eukprot:TRINITY_DN1778_c0_g2_i1.p2 TRINITY_DN1778_c0_g2~~TRINITY_DN1778_c0_g2_i1.p2  ORF type:complete len:119 (+),score=9.36 TRINITY_DN1778_c0_g2_i1:536-892(+)
MFGFTIMELTWIYTYRMYGCKVSFAMSVAYITSMTYVLYSWFCDSLLITDGNLLGLFSIKLCGPHNVVQNLSLAFLILISTWALPIYAYATSKTDTSSDAVFGSGDEATELTRQGGRV